MPTDRDFESSIAFKPMARTADLVVQDIEKEILVYDLTDKKANHLNEMSAQIWRFCDGKTTISEIASKISEKSKSEIGTDLVMLALDDLNNSSLLESFDDRYRMPAISRRKVLFRYALPAITLPVVVSLVAPLAVTAQSCAPGFGQIGDPCFSTPDCCPGLTCLFFGIPAPGVCQIIN